MGEENVCVNNGKEDVSDLELKIIRQVEYYFGDFNLAKDKFLREQMKEDEGWVSLETLVKFKRLQSLSEDFEVITTALKKSPNNLIEVNEDSSKIRRTLEKPLPEDNEEHRKERDEKTLYVKGFKKTTTLDELLEYFKPHKCENILMRRNPHNRTFKGSVFITFENKDDAIKFLENKTLKFDGVKLLKETKKAYTERKDIFYANLRKEKEEKLLGRKGSKEQKDESVTLPKLDIKEGCCMKVTGLDANMTREILKEGFDYYGNIVYVDYNRGKPTGVIRYEEGIVAEILKKIPEEDGERKVKIGSSNAVVTLIEGDEEKEYFNTIALHRANTFALKKSRSHKGFKQGGNKGRFKKNWNKRTRGNANNENDVSDEDNKREKVTNIADNEPPMKKMKPGTNVETADS